MATYRLFVWGVRTDGRIDLDFRKETDEYLFPAENNGEAARLATEHIDEIKARYSRISSCLLKKLVEVRNVRIKGHREPRRL